jgi:transposase InsO family protein
MHGPLVAGDPRQKKSYLIAFIDDHSRLVPYARFYYSEKLEVFLDAFEKALLKRGLPRKLYVDNGSAYRSKHLEHICASLGIALVHAKPYQPAGKGKIERFNRRVRQQFLPTVKSGMNSLNWFRAKSLKLYWSSMKLRSCAWRYLPNCTHRRNLKKTPSRICPSFWPVRPIWSTV